MHRIHSHRILNFSGALLLASAFIGNPFVFGQGMGGGEGGPGGDEGGSPGGGVGGGAGSGAVGGSPIRSSPPTFGSGTGSTSGSCKLEPSCHTMTDGDEGKGKAHDGELYDGECGSSCSGFCINPNGGSNDIPPPTQGAGGGNGGNTGCNSCSGGSGSGSVIGPMGSMRADFLSRVWLPNNRANNSSLSPGYYTQFDSQLNVFPETNGTAITFFDVYSGRVYQALDGLEGDPLDGVYNDIKNKHIKDLRLYTTTGASTSNPLSAATGEVTLWNGVKEVFEFVDMDASSATVLAGRLKKRVDLDGNALMINYKTWTAAEIAASPDRQWQIDNVTDAFGSTLAFTYNAAQQSGRWSISRVDRNDGTFVTYGYSSGMLSNVTYMNGEQSTFVYGQDAVAQTATVTVRDVVGENRDVKYHLTNDYMTLPTSGQAQVINQPLGVRRMIEQPNTDVEWILLPATNPAIDLRFIFFGGNRAQVVAGNFRSQVYDEWQMTAVGGTSPGGPPTLSGTFSGIDGVLNPQISGPPSNVTQAQLYTSTSPSFTNQKGTLYNFQYDSAGRTTRITYAADNSFSDFAYNSIGLITRERDRAGNVTKYTYDAQGHMLTKQVGLIEQSGNDVQTDAFAQSTFEYYPSTHVNKGLLKAELSALYNSSTPTVYRKDFEYNSAGLVTKITASADTSGGTRPVTQIAYNANNQKTQVTDPEGRITGFEYDTNRRLVKTIYPDSTTEQTLYGAAGTATVGKVLKTKDRMNVVTVLSYDTVGRLIQKTSSAAFDSNILDGQADDTPITDPNIRTVSDYVYLDGSTNIVTMTKVNGSTTEMAYDFHNRPVSTKQYSRSGTTLTSTKVYANNQLLYDQDPYGRRKYYGYRASDGTLIRTITCTVPEQTFADFTAVWNQVRDASANAKFVIHDAIRDAQGRLTQIIDGRGIETRMEYDAQGRETNKRVAFGTAIEARTQTIYNAAGQVDEVRTPRYFDSTDTLGASKARETWTYNGRGLVATHAVSPGTAEAAVESFTYDLGGHQASRTDFGNNVWTRIEDSCCEKQTASVDPLGHGTITNTDSLGRSVHTIQVSEVSTHVGSFANPTDAKTLAESTTRYDAAGRPTHQTTWLTPRGAVDPANPPIAGLNGIPATDGLTTQYFYDNNLTDGVGLDNATGVAVLKLGTGGSGTFNVSLSSAISKLAGTVATGGAGITFNATAPGRATVTVNSEDEISFSISDATGRSVMSGKLNNYRGTGPTALGTLASWSCTLHDATTNLAGYGTLLVTQNIDALGNATKTWTDAAGRTLRSLDQLDKVVAVTYDAGGNQLTVRDPNNVGADMVYDALGRNTQRTDTFGDITKTDYDRSGNAVKQTDAKNKFTLISFDSRNRRKSTTDRITASTNFVYTALGQLLSLTDAENQTTAYTYDARGSKLTEQYPDHVANSTVGQPGYGIVTFVYDKAGRISRKQDQAGDTCSYNYDLAGRMTSRNYRTAANSPSGTIADTDTFTFDRAGRMLTAVNGRYTNTVTYAFDPAGRKASEGLTISGQTYTIGSSYNARNELVSYTYPDGSVADRAYTARGALSQLKLDAVTVDTRTYDDGGRMLTSTLGNGITETRAYRTDNLLTSINSSNTNLGNLAYTWDVNKNKTAETITGVMSNYGFTAAGTTYDFEDRLTGFRRAAASGPALLSQSWSLSTVGDWNSVTTNGTAQTRTHGPTHELLTAGGQSVTTDVKGNTTLLPAVLSSSSLPSTASSLTYDFDNKLRSVDLGNNASVDVNYQYDALGRRVARTGTGGSVVYVQADQQTIADYPLSGAPATPTYRYVYGSYIDEPVVRKGAGTSGTVHYYHSNQQYSIYAITDAAASIAERYAYTAYGQPTILNAAATVIAASAVSNRYTYTAREWDATVGLYHFRARWMSGLTGRFLSRDPIGFEGSPYDLYEYCESKPMFMLDPSGTAVLVIPIAGGAAGAAAAASAAAQAAEAAALAAGVSLLVCLQSPPCAAQVRLAVERALANIDALAKAALITACNAAYEAYKALPTCERCVRGYADNCILSIWRCAHATKNYACHNTVAAARAAYLISGCDVVLPPKAKDHWLAVEQALNGADRCRESMDNNCFGNEPLPELY